VSDRTAEALEVCAGAGGGLLLLPDNLLLSPDFVTAFLAIAGTRPKVRPLVAAMGPGLAATRYAGRSVLAPGPDGSLPVPLVLIPEGVDVDVPTTPADLMLLAADAEPVVVDTEEKTKEIPVSRAYADPGKDTLSIGATRRLAVHLTHRSHLINANHDTLASEFLGPGGSKLRVGLHFLLLGLRYLAGRLWPFGARRLVSRIGKGCTIHPTAIVEASRLGDGVEIGAYSIVRASVLGDGVVIEDHSRIIFCVAGDKVRFGSFCSQFACVMMERAHSTQLLMQGCVLGRDAVVTAISWFTDVSFGRNIRVEAPRGSDKKLLDSGSRFLGCDVGHDTIVGFQVATSPGRFLPSHCTVVSEAPSVMKRIDPSIDPLDAKGATLTVRDGVLVPL
jgi:carbonic anhydrase/acetyltransferase-like protein (isoleucine patch superfamily)